MTHVPDGAPSPMTDAERDAYLEVALRHAPDAGIDAPASVSAAILREARGAAAQAAPSRPGSGKASGLSGGAGVAAALLRFWTWLARPPVAGAFASVMVATLAGVMWWGEPIERTLERPMAKADSAPAAPAAPAERVAPVPAVTSVEPPPALTERPAALADARVLPRARKRAEAAPGVADPPTASAARATLQSSPPQAGNAAATDSAAHLARQAQASLGAARVPADEGSAAAAAPAPAPAGIGAGPAPEEPARLHLPSRANPATPEANERADEVRAATAAGVTANAGAPADVPLPRSAAEVVQQAPAKAGSREGGARGERDVSARSRPVRGGRPLAGRGRARRSAPSLGGADIEPGPEPAGRARATGFSWRHDQVPPAFEFAQGHGCRGVKAGAGASAPPCLGLSMRHCGNGWRGWTTRQAMAGRTPPYPATRRRPASCSNCCSTVGRAPVSSSTRTRFGSATTPTRRGRCVLSCPRRRRKT